jgi:multimeric flavodoxin WrbA
MVVLLNVMDSAVVGEGDYPDGWGGARHGSRHLPYGKCVLHDDLVSVLEKIAAANALVIGSPIYFGTVIGEIIIISSVIVCWE